MLSDVHQIIIGALNAGENSFSVGDVEGLNFVACAVGADVVILAPNLERIHIIIGRIDAVVSSVNCCRESGKIAACYGSFVQIFEPIQNSTAKNIDIFAYQWTEVQTIHWPSVIFSVQWALKGLRLLIVSDEDLLLYQHKILSTVVVNRPATITAAGANTTGVKFMLTDEEVLWENVWNTKLSDSVKHIRFSPDGSLFATCGENDRFIKIWYQMKDSSVFSFIYIQHPAPVCGFEWRIGGRYMKCVQNAIITWCEDNTSRVWKEVPSRDTTHDSILEAAETAMHEKQRRERVQLGGFTGGGGEGTHRHFHLKHAKRRLIKKLSHIVNDKKTARALPTFINNTINNNNNYLGRTLTIADFSMPASANSLLFALAATINAENDCYLMPTMGARSTRPFTVHWLNNKAMFFTRAIERVLAETLLTEQNQQFCHPDDRANAFVSSTSSTDVTTMAASAEHIERVIAPEEFRHGPLTVASTPALSQQDSEKYSSCASDVSSARDMIDVKLEQFLRQWNKSADVLFAIHPVDGSLLTWTMEWLDDTWRQANVNFASRFPDAFPLTDAVSIYPTLSVFDAYEPTLTKYLRQAISDSGYERYNDTNIISLLTNHENGSLNLWQLSMDEQRGHATPLNLTHRNRICGHRFYISQVVAHPALPLLLTTSQFSPSTVIGTRQSRQQSPRSYDDDAIGKLERDKDIHDEFADVTRESELILWSTSPVAPLCKSGGLRELARVTSRLAQPFSFMAWIPITIPSFVMGAECNSSSSCFIVSSDGILSIYQAIVDARGILAHVHKSHRRMQDFIHKENSDSENCTQISINDYKATKTSSIAMFNVISTQSSARPGCILHVGNVINSKHKSDEIIFLHVFVEDLAAYSFSKPTNVESKLDGASKDNGKTNQFKGFEKTTPISQNNRLIFVEKYLLVMIVRTGEEDRLRMWTLTISAKSLSLAPEIANDNVSSPTSATVLLTQKSREIFYPTAETDVIQLTATKLYTESEMVYDEALNFGLNVRISSCTAAAGHLSSASLYPSCKTPYTLLAACTDDKVRFLRCNVVEADVDRNSSSKRVYRWTCWKMANELTDSLLEMDGEIFSVSSAYSGRFACVSRCAGATCVANAFAFNNDGTSVAFVDAVPAIARRLELAVFECESSGGVEWIREETFVLGDILDNYFRKYSAAILSSDNVSYITNTNNAVDIQRTCSTLVRIDWVSAEDGSHVLTVGIGNYILLFVQVSQNIAQQNIVMMKEHESVCAKRAPPPLRKSSSLVNTAVNSECLVRWMCIRILELQSADGLPPIPTALSWVRDGLLIVGMNSEMRVYNQWNLNTRSDSKNNEENSIQNHTASLANPLAIVKGTTMESVISISRSHSMLNQLNRKGVDQRAASSRALTDLMNRVLSSSRFLPNTASSISAIVTGERDELSNGGILRAVSGEGLFEASRLANPILPQYHPKQLIEMLNAGKIKRVKAILLHVLYALRHRQVSLPNPLSRAASFRRMYSRDACATGADSMSVNGAGTLREESTANPDYDELDTISPLPLYALMAADQTASGFDTVENIDCADKRKYDSLFNAVESDDDLDEMLNGIQNESETLSQRSASRSRQSSESSERPAHTTATSGRVDFTTRHSRLLTELLTHTHLPGLSSVDQMHLLAIADTISHFSSNAMDKLQHANAALKPVMASTLDDTSASGYANATTGTETVDECGLRFLMAMKQHEYLLLCLPPMQRKLLKSRGISTAHIIWAFHSVTEAELLGAIPCCQKSQEMWDDLKAFGVAWWLKNTSMLRICVEKMAKCAFQQNQDPMDASLFYLALRKKNVLMHLFKTVNNSRMYEFFREDFTEEKWKRAALKNAFVLMSKQRFQHAAAFFLLGGSLKDAVQTILSRLRDIQLAMVVVRLYETDLEIQNHIMAELLCHEVLGCEPEDIYARDNSCDAYIRDQETHCANFPYTSR